MDRIPGSYFFSISLFPLNLYFVATGLTSSWLKHPYMKISPVASILFRSLGTLFLLFFTSSVTNAQLRQIYSDMVSTENNIKNISFFTPSQGYIASTDASWDWVGYTADSGRTFVKRPITLSNVDYNGYSVNLTFGFGIEGVKAFDQNNILVYGDYGLVPAILKSSNGGATYLLVYHSQVGPTTFSTLYDVLFPQDNTTGFAVDGYKVIKTTNGGSSWNVVYNGAAEALGALDATDNNNVFAFSSENSGTTGGMIKTTTGGVSWQTVTLPDTHIKSAEFITPSKGWISVNVNIDSALVYYTSNGGVTWVKKNSGLVNPIILPEMHFINDSVGIGITGLYTTYKTTDSGRVWEPIRRDNNFSYLGFGHNDLFFINENQFWCGGGRDFLEISTNAGGIPIPRSLFKIDTSALYTTNTVYLQNYSKPGYTFKWYRNNVLLSTAYHSSYIRDPASTHDSIKLVVNNGTASDSLTRHQYFPPPVIVSGFTPTSGGAGAVITITGQNLNNLTAVRFGGVPATALTIVSPTTIKATVTTGASGYVRVMTTTGQDSLAGFTFIPAPTLTSFSPAAATAGTTVIINGTNLTGATSVTFGGVSSTFLVLSPTQIQAIAPSGPSGSITVITPGGTASLTGYSSLPAISSFTPIKGTHGTIITITGTNLTGTTSVTIGGVPAVSFTVNSSTSITAEVGAGATGNVSVSRPEGTASLGTFTWIPPPVITTFSPASGPVGTTVTITGTGFHNTITGNTVYFGATKANITTATSTSLTVVVPVGATFSNFSVATNNLVAYSAQPFLVTFPNGGSITPSSFITNLNINTGNQVLPYGAVAADFDGDGKTDIAVLKSNNPVVVPPGVLVYRNTGTGADFGFTQVAELSGGSESVATADFDGDGKTDIVMNAGSNLIIHLNISTSGNISFLPAVTFTNSYTPGRICVADVDMDGKTDIISNNRPSAGIAIRRNISEPGTLAFKPAVIVTGGPSERNITSADLNGDGKPELLISGAGILKNNCTPGIISFDPPLDITPYTHSYITAGDMDGDGKADVIGGDLYGSGVMILRNTGSGPALSFAAPVTFTAVSYPGALAVADFDGDGKPDLTASLQDKKICVFKNLSTPGNIVLKNRVDYVPGSFGSENQVVVADWNNDGKNDIALTSQLLRSVTFFRNEVKPEPSVYSFTPTLAANGASISITGNNFTGITAVSFGGVPAASFTVNSPTSITAILGTGASGAVAVTNPFGTDSLTGFVYGAPPVITSLSPESGNVGTTVTITGINFNTTPAANTVYFGATKARVLTATATTLTVTVPFGSAYEPVSVTNNNLTAFSPKPFITTFTNSTNTLTAANFAPRIDLTGIPAGVIADIDGDGKPDLAGGWTSTSFAVARNTSITGSISFAYPTIISGMTGSSGAACGDLNGDGKKDLVFIGSGNYVSVVKNTSVPGNISFDPKVDYSTGSISQPSSIHITDVDADGKPDILVSNYGGQTVTLLKNNSLPNQISFAERVDYALDGYGNDVDALDLDGDGKPEIFASANGANEVSVFKNNSLPGNPAFAAKTDLAAGAWPSTVAAGDLDADNKAEIIVSNANAGTISVFKNNSTVGSISFAPKSDIATGSSVFGNGINDLNGDGKPDLYIPNFGSATLSLLANNSTAGSLLFQPKSDIPVSNNPFSVLSGDLDGDGKADIVISNSGSPASILRNITGGAGPAITSFLPISGVSGNTITITGLNFTGTTAVSFGGVAATSFTVVSPTVITAILGNGSSGEVMVTTPAGVAGLPGFIYGNKPVITEVNPMQGITGETITITGANFTGTTSVSFGTVAAASYSVNSSTNITAVLGNGASGKVKVLTPSGEDSLAGFQHYPVPVITSFTPQTGISGSTITITGSGFTGATAVKFGTTNATSFTVVSPTTITAVISDVSTGNVEVFTPGGVASLGGFIYGNPPIITRFYPKTGTTGSTIFITGINLGRATGVQFGGIPASSYQLLSPTTIAAVVAAGASGNVTLTSPNGPTNKTGFTYVAPGIPLINSINPGTGTTGSVITLSGYNFTGATAVSFGGTAAASFSVMSDTVITAVIGAGSSGEVKVTAAGGNGVYNSFIYTNGPLITSISPVSAAPGSTVQITGANFSSAASNNLVYFGNVAATVTSASSTILNVTVPYGAALGSLSVTRDGLSAWSSAAFIPTFSGSGVLNPSAFVRRLDSVSQVKPAGITLGDLNADGKPDLTIANTGVSGNPGNFLFYKNNSIQGDISFAPSVKTTNTSGPVKIGHVDFNGDGKQDLLVSNGSDLNAIHVYPNTSTGGNLSFGTSILLTGQLGPFKAAFGDFDSDGKPDIAFISAYSSSVLIYQNTSTGGAISFGPRLTFPGTQFTGSIVTTDIDQDGKTDIVINSNTNYLLALRNTSSAATISFESVQIPTELSATDIAAGDIDNDGKPDLVTTSLYNNRVFILKNYSVPGFVIYEAKRDYSAAGGPGNLTLMDVTGDSKNDILISCGNENGILVYSNKSTPNAVAFALPVQVPVSSPGGYITACDMDMDGKPEIIRANPQSNSVSILYNGQPTVTVTDVNLCTGAGTNLSSGLSGSTYQWQMNTGNGFSNITNNSNFTGVNTATLQVQNVPVSWNGYLLQSVINGSLTGTIYRLNVAQPLIPVITISGTTVVQPGQTVTISSTITNGGLSPVYQWQDSTALHNWQNITGANAPTIDYTAVNNGDRLRCRLTSTATCPNPAQVNSNVLQFTVTPVTAINPVNGNRFGIRLFPNPAETSIHIDSLKTADKWNVLQVLNMSGALVIPAIDITNRVTVSVNIQAWPAGYYLLILQRRNGRPAYLTFIKQ